MQRSETRRVRRQGADESLKSLAGMSAVAGTSTGCGWPVCWCVLMISESCSAFGRTVNNEKLISMHKF